MRPGSDEGLSATGVGGTAGRGVAGQGRPERDTPALHPTVPADSVPAEQGGPADSPPAESGERAAHPPRVSRPASIRFQQSSFVRVFLLMVAVGSAALATAPWVAGSFVGFRWWVYLVGMPCSALFGIAAGGCGYFSVIYDHLLFDPQGVTYRDTGDEHFLRWADVGAVWVDGDVLKVAIVAGAPVDLGAYRDRGRPPRLDRGARGAATLDFCELDDFRGASREKVEAALWFYAGPAFGSGRARPGGRPGRPGLDPERPADTAGSPARPRDDSPPADPPARPRDDSPPADPPARARDGSPPSKPRWTAVGPAPREVHGGFPGGGASAGDPTAEARRVAARRVRAVFGTALAAAAAAVGIALNSGVGTDAEAVSVVLAAAMGGVALVTGLARVVFGHPDARAYVSHFVVVASAVGIVLMAGTGAIGAIAFPAALAVGAAVAGAVFARVRRYVYEHRPPGATGPAGVLAGQAPVGFAPDGRVLATRGPDKTAALWDVTDPAHPAQTAILPGHRRALTAVGFCPGRLLLATGGHDKAVILWGTRDPARPVRHATLEARRGHGPNRVNVVAFSPDGALLAVGGGSKTAVLWDVNDCERPVQTSSITDRHDYVTDLSFSPDGHLLAVAAAGTTHVGGAYASTIAHRSVTVWDIGGGHPRQAATLVDATGSEFDGAVSFSPAGRLLAAVSAAKAVTLWDVTDADDPVQTAVITISSHWLTGDAHAVAFSPDGHLLATTTDFQTILLWDVTNPEDPQLAGTLAGQGRAVRSAAFSPDGQLLATGSTGRGDSTVTLWNLP